MGGSVVSELSMENSAENQIPLIVDNVLKFCSWVLLLSSA